MDIAIIATDLALYFKCVMRRGREWGGVLADLGRDDQSTT
jgi:hypothetical protein